MHSFSKICFFLHLKFVFPMHSFSKHIIICSLVPGIKLMVSCMQNPANINFYVFLAPCHARHRGYNRGQSGSYGEPFLCRVLTTFLLFSPQSGKTGTRETIWRGKWRSEIIADLKLQVPITIYWFLLA